MAAEAKCSTQGALFGRCFPLGSVADNFVDLHPIMSLEEPSPATKHSAERVLGSPVNNSPS
jgi:hypothetical protein